MRVLAIGSIVLFCFFMTACDGSSSANSSSDNDSAPDNVGDNNQTRCKSETKTVAWDLLLTTQAKKLSDYRLFEKNCDPTVNPSMGGIPYDLTTGLFTDYSTKYRFVFIPPGKSATYSENEVLEYPVGTALVKTFSVPKDTAIRGYSSEVGFEGETLVETRLLIRREGGWVAIPYVWNDDATDADLRLFGKTIAMSLIHNGEQKDFSYAVPDIQTCKQCHQLTSGSGDKSVSRFAPIGPKARLLNRDIEYKSGRQNQLAYMVEHDLLTGAPLDLSTINTIPRFNDQTDIANKTHAELEALAKGYLDINCAHCHRRTGKDVNDGKAGYSGLKLENWREFDSNINEHGVCKIPIAFSVQGLAFDIVPGNAAKSILPYRMELQSAKRMPEVGRDLVHGEGVALINAWINSMESNTCGQ